MRQPRIKEVKGRLYWRCSACKEYRLESAFDWIIRNSKGTRPYKVPVPKCKPCWKKWLKAIRRKSEEDLFK